MMIPRTILGLFCGILCSQDAISQVINRGQAITIVRDTEVRVTGDFVNQGALANNGTLLLGGDWHNTSGYSGEGTVVLDGRQMQNIDHNGEEFYHLVADGKGEKIFTTSAVVSKELYLKEGILTPGAEVVLLIKDNAYVSDGSPRSYVNGRLFHQGTGEKYYPIGKGGSFKPVFLKGQGQNPVVGFELFEPNPFDEHTTNIKEVSSSRYWQKTLLSGSLNEQSMLILPVSSDGLDDEMAQLVIAGASMEDQIFRVSGEPVTSGFMDNGTISSAISMGSDYFVLAMLEDATEIVLYIPNAFAPFSPSAKGEDKVLKVYGKDISEQGFLFRIYDRWGTVVYETASYDEASRYGWNGTDPDTGQPQSLGAYQYILKGVFNSGKSIDRKGSIYLIR